MLKQFEKYLKDKQLKVTKERMDIARVATSFSTPFNSIQLYSKIKSMKWPISESTLYRTLPMLVEANLLKMAYSPNLKTKLFIVVNSSEKDNSITCVKCGSIFSIEEKDIDILLKDVCNKYNFKEVSKATIRLLGACYECTNEKTKQGGLDMLHNFEKVRVFVIEDDEVVNELIVEFLCEYPEIEVYSITDPSHWFCPLETDEGCPRNHTIMCGDYLITDINMLSMNGLDFVSVLNKKRCKIPNIALMTGNPRSDQSKNAVRKGYNIFFKPFHLDQIIDWIQNGEKNIPLERELIDL